MTVPRRTGSSPALAPGRARTARLPWACFFDVDGTLAEIAASPSGARVPEETQELLGRLVVATHGAVALISGRSIADVDRMFPRLHLPVAGQHGVERRNAAGVRTADCRPSDQLADIRRRLALAAATHPGLLIEDKGLSVAVHYRGAPQLATYVLHLVRTLQQDLGREFSVQRGKRVIEILPSGWHKGHAIRAYLAEEPFRGALPVFLGDDITDEKGFDVVNRLGGVSIKVGRGRTAARWRLRDVAAVRRWLEQSLALYPNPERA